ncbi:MAG TPA: hypothetical protein VLZ83_05970 [Edaphocola sp.]|nr:hypothetical protein [Edaphocola sp.]
MKYTLLKKALAVTLISGICTPQAFSGVPNFFKRLEIGFSYNYSPSVYKSVENITAGNGATFTKDLSYDVKPKMALGGMIGTYFPIKRFSENVLLAVHTDIAINVNMWDFKLSTFRYFKTDGDGNPIEPIYNAEYSEASMKGNSMLAGLPISVDLKFGGEANLQNYAKTTGSIGVGVYPMLNITKDFGTGDQGFFAAPFVKAEIGKKMGIFWKLRAQYVFGEIPFFKEHLYMQPGTSNISNGKLIGNGMASVSLVLMPFSWDFRNDGWWNSGK